MSATGLEVFDDTLHKTNSWLKQIGEQLNLDRRRAYHVLRAGLHCLRDRLTVEEAAHLSDQLPMLVRGIYFEAWRPAGKPEKIRSREEFLDRFRALWGTAEPIDAEAAVSALFQVLERHVSPGEIEDVIQTLPKDLRTLWPALEQPAR
jgi:uncharacterized protein (DUF2267 family)